METGIQIYVRNYGRITALICYVVCKSKTWYFLFNSLSIMKKILLLMVLCVAQLATVHAQMKEQNTSSVDEAWNYIGSSQ